MEQNGLRARIAKSPYLTSGESTSRELFIVAVTFSIIALLFGTIIFLKQGITCLYLALAAGILGYFYSGRPLRLSYHGLGELIIGIVFGPLLMSGVYYSATGHFATPIWYISGALGLLVINILFTHSILDKEADIRNGKHTLAAVLHHDRLNLIASAIFNFAPYLILIVAVLLHILRWTYLSVILLLPLSIYLYYLLVEFIKDPQREFPKRWWMGPIEHWKEIEDAGLGWFAIRWFSARNIMQFISILLIACSIIEKL